MTICPVALAVGCKKCPVFAICPAKGIIGDQGGEPAKAETTAGKSPSGKKKPKK